MRRGAAADDASGDAASGAEDDVPEVHSYMTYKDVMNISEESKEELRQVQATDAPQSHFQVFKWDAAAGAMVEVDASRAAKSRTRADVFEQLPSLADPIP